MCVCVCVCVCARARVCVWRAKAIRVGWRRMDGGRDRREEQVEPDDQRDEVAKPILVLEGRDGMGLGGGRRT